jgi:hypothetical protein
MFCEAPASSEPRVNAPIANSSTGRRPYRSETLPYSGVDVVEATRYAVTTHE